MNDRDGQKRQSALRALREERGQTLEAAQQRLKEQTRVRRQIVGSLKEGPQTVPALAKATGLPTEAVFWHLMAMKKYGQIMEAEQEGDYYQYQLSEK